MRHYFIPSEQTESFSFDVQYAERNFSFSSGNDVFSKNKLDDGSRLLIDAVLSQVIGDEKCTVLYLGCGVGTIGIILASMRPNMILDMADINSTAVRLSTGNVERNKVTNVRSVVESSGYEKLSDKYDYIITNPPIKAGKSNLFNLIESSKNNMTANAKLVLVIRKKHGEESAKKHMESVFRNCKILKRDKGYYILSSEKIDTE